MTQPKMTTLSITVRLTLLILTIFLSACSTKPNQVSTPTPLVGDISAASAAQAVMEEFLAAWGEEDYTTMYSHLSSLSQDAISQADFEALYEDAASKMTLEALSFQLLSAIGTKDSAEVAFRVDFDLQLLSDLRRENIAHLVREGGVWRIQWEKRLILPEMGEEYQLEFVHQTPSRGRILDRDGAPLAAYEDAIAVGVVPGEMLATQADLVYSTLAEISIHEPETIQSMVESTPDDWYLPIVTLSHEEVTPHMETLRGLLGVRIDEFRSRYYVDGGVAPHVLGYLLHIPEEELETYLRKGYSRDERIGSTGLEAVYEEELSGKRGGSLYLVDGDGRIQTLLAASEPEEGQTLTTTLDKDLQMRLQASLGDLRAAVVVMEVNSGRILSLVSNPDFDPNVFDLGEADRDLLDSYFSDDNQPLFNRATQGQYPLGSIFKTVTMAAAMENDLYQANSSFNCGHRLWVCDSVWLEDWTLSHGTAASGQLTLVEGLMRSCNPWFYRIGEGLFNEGMADALSEMAFGYGLGEETGIEILEAAGNIPETAGTCVNSAQMSIGQGEILVTPIQVAVYFSALANGGSRYRPSLVGGIKSAEGEMTYEFKTEIQGKLPIEEETLEAIRQGLQMVVEEPRGTGYWAMTGLEIPVSGKTGTAQTPSGNSHAWFAGYTRQNDPQRPDIAVVVLVENGGEGSVMAAPVFRRAVSLYFSDGKDPGGLMPWEFEPYVTEAPNPTATPTSSE
mgnify:CR=1 FL=1